MLVDGVRKHHVTFSQVVCISPLCFILAYDVYKCSSGLFILFKSDFAERLYKHAKLSSQVAKVPMHVRLNMHAHTGQE
jgi:hypothetical protein